MNSTQGLLFTSTALCFQPVSFHETIESVKISLNKMDLLAVIPKEIFYLILKIALILIGASVTMRLIKTGRLRLESGVSKSKRTEEQVSQFHTMMMVGEYILRIIVIFVASVWILSLFGVNILPVITTVGVAGLAITLGAQTIIKDYIGGVIILIENLYYIGDTVTIGTSTGVVEKITLRSTYLRDNENHLVIVPNGDIRTLVLVTRN